MPSRPVLARAARGTEHRQVTCCVSLCAPLGRVLIGQGGVDGQKQGLAIAIRYACARPQFGDKPIMAYVTHQARLLPALANT